MGGFFFLFVQKVQFEQVLSAAVLALWLAYLRKWRCALCLRELFSWGEGWGEQVKGGRLGATCCSVVRGVAANGGTPSRALTWRVEAWAAWSGVLCSWHFIS